MWFEVNYPSLKRTLGLKWEGEPTRIHHPRCGFAGGSWQSGRHCPIPWNWTQHKDSVSGLGWNLLLLLEGLWGVSSIQIRDFTHYASRFLTTWRIQLKTTGRKATGMKPVGGICTQFPTIDFQSNSACNAFIWRLSLDRAAGGAGMPRGKQNSRASVQTVEKWYGPGNRMVCTFITAGMLCNPTHFPFTVCDLWA